MQATCKELFQDLLDKLSTSEYVWPPPKEMPSELVHNYTLNGRVQVSVSPWCSLKFLPAFCMIDAAAERSLPFLSEYALLQYLLEWRIEVWYLISAYAIA